MRLSVPLLPLVLLVPLVPLNAQAPRPVALDAPVTGTLSASDSTLGDGSYYQLWLFRAEPGTRVRVTLHSDDFDAYLSVGTMQGDEFVEDDSNDDFDAPNTDSRLDATVPAAGVLAIRANSFEGGETGDYTLSVTLAPHAAVAGVRPLAPGTAAIAEFGAGDPTRENGAPVHFWRFEAQEGARYAVLLYSTEVDTYLSIGEGEGDAFTPSETSDDVEDSSDSRIIFTADHAGPVMIRASTYGAGEAGVYHVAVQWLPPRR